jgi:O-antigen ligase
VAVTILLSTLVLTLPLMMGHRTPETLTATALLMIFGALLAFALSGWRGQAGHRLPLPSTGWWIFLGLMTLSVALQVVPLKLIAWAFGPYPSELWNHAAFEPRTWSPNPSATLRGWAVFSALFTIAWLARSLRSRQRHWLFLAIAGMALFQALYGLVSHAGGADTIFGIWERHSTDFVHGSYSNGNLFAGYLALTWPLAVSVWWIRGMPLLHRLPVELRIAGSVISGAVIGAALMGSASRLGSVAGSIGMLTALLLWTRHRGKLQGAAIWPAWAAALAAFLFATWYGLEPLTDRLAGTGAGADAYRLTAFELMIQGFPPQWWLHGVGLGGFEAVFKLVQTEDVSGWWDYAHNDLLQWVLEMGLVGVVLLGMVVTAIARHAEARLERIPLYAGLAALCVVALGDFSWHIPGTQVVLAIYIGVLTAPAPNGRRSSGRPRKQRRRHRSHTKPVTRTR